jgi:ribosome-associated translation inhibitor RaiA
MINIVFRNLDKSELAREAVIERIGVIVEKFPDLQESRINVNLEMHNSPLQAGPDHFTVKTECASGRYRGIRVEKSAPSLYVALADVAEHLLELLNRHGDRARVKARKIERRFSTQINRGLADL